MHMQIKGWTQFIRLVRWSVVFYHVEGLWLYLLLKSDVKLKEGGPCGKIMLITGQCVNSIHLLREDLWFFYVKKRDYSSHSRIQSPIKQLEKLGLFTAELFLLGFLFKVPGGREALNGRKQAETEEASTAEVQPKNRPEIFLSSESESVVEDT
ncbi:hypothetical protein [Bacillus sp. AG4(2022)]|uniref:hypothetical protein n=1 Tax=Bacillus sp. AG4(2022) TaxID=2962594 RepID=UPI002880D6CE|nr:hypothetical protein [Bacillus sp. AG4(2022)]MDT0159254.1 hypothetical protein [Bacillus sp. AG4(2022)]